jgi:serine/threonine-protein kinase
VVLLLVVVFNGSLERPAVPPSATPATNNIVLVQDVAGLTEARAVASLTEAGFSVSSQSEHSDTVASGDVIRTDPAAGAAVPRASRVRVFVSSGP